MGATIGVNLFQMLVGSEGRPFPFCPLLFLPLPSSFPPSIPFLSIPFLPSP